MMKRLQWLFFVSAAILITACGSDDGGVMVDVDNQAPAAPLNLTISDVSESSMDLSWDAATDNVGVTEYEIFRNGESFQTLTTTSATISGLVACNDYSFYVVAKDAEGNISPQSNVASDTTVRGTIEFKDKISEMCIFKDAIGELTPLQGVQRYEINSTLFTDYAKKQRLVRLPDGEKMEYAGDDLLPTFPDNTVITKTFYYNIDDRDPDLGQQVIETRVFIKLNGVWEAGNYLWNNELTDAVYTEASREVPISYIDADGNTKNVDYVVPAKQDCFTCHNNSDVTFPIGMKLRNMNFVPSYTNFNQLDYFTNNNLLEGVSSGSISVSPDWTDTSNSLEERARAYMDINCAHCHSPGGSVPDVYMLDLRLEVPYAESGIFDSRLAIKDRFQSVEPFYRMPQLGRTTTHDEAIALLNDYIDSL